MSDVVLAVLEVDGKQVSRASACNAACGRAVSLVCTVNNCTSAALTDLTVQLLSVVLVPSSSAVSLQSHATDRRAVFDSSAVAIGSLTSTFPQVHLSN